MPAGHRPPAFSSSNRSKKRLSQFIFVPDFDGSFGGMNDFGNGASQGSSDGFWETRSRYPYTELMSYFVAASVCVLCPSCCGNALERCLVCVFGVCPERPGDLETFNHPVFNPLNESGSLEDGESAEESGWFWQRQVSRSREKSSRIELTKKKKRKKKKLPARDSGDQI
jgi:hypothetical protein